MAKLFVPSGTPVHDNCGETFSPTQFGLFDKLLATFRGIIWPSLIVVDLKVNGSAARPVGVNARTIPAAAIIFRKSCHRNIRGPPLREAANFITKCAFEAQLNLPVNAWLGWTG